MPEYIYAADRDIFDGVLGTFSAEADGPTEQLLSISGQSAPDLADLTLDIPCSLTYGDENEPEEDEICSEALLAGFTIRLSEQDPTYFWLFYERFIKWWNRKTFNVKYDYTRGFIEKKKWKTDKALPLFDKLAVEWAERHLNNDYWEVWKWCPSKPIWLALHMPRWTTVDAIDFDAKQHRVGDYWKERRPLVHLPLDHFKQLKRIYDAFPGRIWCISSETLGMHVWQVHDRLKPPLELHERNKRVLANIGLPSVESHPMQGRCFRRPFGLDYRTITPEGVLNHWSDQVQYFEFDRRTPSFPQFCEALIDAMQTQQNNWNRASVKEATKLRTHWQVPKEVPHIQEIRDWLAAGCPLDPVVPVSLPKTETELLMADVFHQMTGEKAPEPHVEPAVSTIKWEPTPVAINYRGGQWPKALRTWSTIGLTEPDSVGTVIHEMAKWLYWVELFEMPASEREVTIVALLKTFVKTKHNKCISRLLAGKTIEVKKQIKRCVESAIRLQANDKQRSLNIFANIRKNLSDGKYKYPFEMVPILEGKQDEESQSVSSSPSSWSISSMCIRFAPESLPQAILEKIRAKAGRRKLLPFAAKLMSYLVEHEGSAFIGRPLFFKMLGYENPTRLNDYLKIIEAADVISRGTSYSTGRNGKKCSLSSWAIKELTGQDPSETQKEEDTQSQDKAENLSSFPEPPESLLRRSSKSGDTDDQLASSDLMRSLLERIKPALDCLC